jgi:Cu2+-exporting ATPase
VLPAEKSARVAELTALGRKVLMVGDGLNDTAALAAAHVSISPATALDAARVASDIVLLGQDIAPIADAVRIGRQSARRMIENFMISGGYNVIAVPLALSRRCNSPGRRLGDVAVLDYRLAERNAAEIGAASRWKSL